MNHYVIVGDELVDPQQKGGPIQEGYKEFKAADDEDAERHAEGLAKNFHHWELLRRVSVHPFRHETV